MSRSARAVLALLADYVALGTGIACTALVTPFALRTLGAEGYGVWALLLSLAGYLSLLDLGQSPLLIRRVAQAAARSDPGGVSRLLAQGLGFYFVVGSVSLGASFVFALLLPHLFHPPPTLAAAAQQAAGLLGLSAALRLLAAPMGIVLTGHNLAALINSTHVAATLATAGFSLAALAAGKGLVGLAASTAIGTVCTLVVQLALVRRRYPWLRPDWRGLSRPSTNALGGSAAYLLTSVSGTLILFTDNVVIAASLGTAAVTAYAIALQLTQLASALVGRVGSVVFASYAELHALQQHGEVAERFLDVSRVALLLSSMFGITLWATGREIIAIWVGADFVLEQSAFAWLVLTPVLAGVVGPAAWLLLAAGRHFVVAVVSVSEAVVNLGLSVFLVHRYGAAGVAAGTAAALVLTGLVPLPGLACRQLRLGVLRYLTRVWAAPLVLALIAASSLSVLGILPLPEEGVGFVATRWPLLALIYLLGGWIALPEHVRDLVDRWRSQRPIGSFGPGASQNE